MNKEQIEIFKREMVPAIIFTGLIITVYVVFIKMMF